MPLDDAAVIAPPQNIEAELALLGSILTRNSGYEIVAGTLRPEHFSEAYNGNIYAAIERERAANRQVSAITLATEFDKKYLAGVLGSTITTINNRDYAAVIIDCWQRRELLSLTRDVQAALGFGTARQMSEIREEFDRRLGEIFTGEDSSDLIPIGDLIDPTLNRIQDAWRNRGKLMGVTTGLIDLDRALGGLAAGQLIIIAGRPGMGKTTLAKTIALAAARAGNVVPFFSLEMSREEIMQGCLADSTAISSMRQRIGGVDEVDIAELSDAGGSLRSLPLLVDDTAGLSMAQIRARCRRLKRQRGLGAIITDHIGLIRASKEAQRHGETAATSEITRELKQLAKELSAPIIALSQLNRAVESRDDKRPTLSDLRQSGSIEQDADVVIFCYREEYYLRKSEPQKKQGEDDEKFSRRHNDWAEALERVHGLADLIIAKQRGGPESTVKVTFEPERSRMRNFARGE